MASSRHYVPNYRRLPAGLLAILAVLAAAVLATGYGYYRHAARQLRLDAESSLHSIADLKANQLARWRMERLGDGLVLQDSPFFSTAAMDLEKNPRNSAVQNALRIRLLETQRAYGYQGCLLLNVKLKVLVSTGHPSSLKNSFLEKLALQTLATGKTHLTDLYLSGSPPRPVMVELIPLFKNPLHRSGQARALAVFTIDPARYLYTILARWPIKTASAESFLAERKEGWVVFLSPLRFKEHAPLQFSLPLSHRGLPAAAAVKGETGVTPGVDYRGVPVFAAIHSIPGTNWLMVAKIDQTEVLAPIRRRAMWTGLFLLLIMGTLGSVAVVGWQWRERRFLRHSLSSQSALAFEREKYQTTFQHAGLGIAQVALDGRWLEVNDQLCRMLGYSRDELLSMTFQDLTHPDDLKRDRSLYQNLRTGNLEKYSVEKRYVTKQRTTFWGNLTVALVRDSEGGPDHFISIIDDITEKKRAEDALKDSELRFKSLFENTMLGLYRTTPAGEILLANPALCGMLGYASFDELKQSNLEAANFHPSYPRDEFKSEIEEKGFVAGLEARWKRKDGRFIWIRESSRAIRDENDCIVYYEGTAEDITERKEAEEAARRKDDLIRMAGEIAKLGGWQFDTATGEGTWTDEVARIHGLNPEDPTSRDIGLQFYRGESKRKIQSALKDVVEKGLPYDLELDLIDAAGREKQVRTQGIPIQEHGKVVQVRGILMDITEQKAAQSRLRLLSEAVEQTHDAVLVTDAKARIVYVNPATETLSGYAANELIGKNPDMFKAGVQDQSFYGDMWNTISSGKTWSGVFVNQRKDGSTYEAQSTISPLRDERGEITYYVSVMRDITRERELEAQLRQTQKMDAVGRLAGGIAHDFNNILAAILSYADLAATSEPPRMKLKEYLREIMRSAERAASLTRQLLSFSRQAGSGESVLQINDCVRSVSAMLERLVGDSIRVETKLQSDLWPVKCDAGKIEQILVNLVVNARDALNQKGRITILSENAPLDGVIVKDEAELPPGRYIRLTVSDTGPGVPRNIQDKIFEPFFTTKPEGQGTGLGLSIVYGLVRSLGGAIHLYSEKGHGACFKIYLPAEEDDAHPSTVQEEQLRLEPGTEEILVAEDDPQVREVVTAVLESLGYTVTAHENVESAALAFEKSPGRYDLLLTDMTMPDGDGLDLAGRLKTRRPSLPVLFMTGYSEDLFRAEGKDVSTKDYLQKPFRRNELALKIRELLDARREGA